ncbi:hypothetical protein GCM10009733_054490 [Nonomuraea maheshkhaliensis]|uniref:Uncharacterized protein n=1 Tax=Nonomuraea maheshkhaliensis TaxID=419590 RepID=A0ABP4RIY8_9ACTN
MGKATYGTKAACPGPAPQRGGRLGSGVSVPLSWPEVGAARTPPDRVTTFRTAEAAVREVGGTVTQSARPRSLPPM